MHDVMSELRLDEESDGCVCIWGKKVGRTMRRDEPRLPAARISCRSPETWHVCYIRYSRIICHDCALPLCCRGAAAASREKNNLAAVP